ncbi:MAG: transcriptional regulator [Candidatus Micrarchaeia archaeon]
MIPCELVVKRVLPVIRRKFVERGVRENKKQKEVALELGLTGAAVSQYLSEKRATATDKATEKTVGELVEGYADKKISFEKKVCGICKDLRASKALCKMHLADGFVPNKVSCNVCHTAC